MLAKCLTAEALKADGNKFDVELIHSRAKNIEEFSAFQELPQDEIVAALSKPSELDRMQRRLVMNTLKVDEMERENYKNAMLTLRNNMKSKEGRSTEYKNLYDAVEAVAYMDLDDNEEVLAAANKKIIQAAKKYIKGKEKVRSGQGGKDRFDNTMDALAIMSQYAPGLKRTIDGMVSDINKKRNVKAGNAKFVQLENYGKERAVQRKQQIDAANNKGKKKDAAVSSAKKSL